MYSSYYMFYVKKGCQVAMSLQFLSLRTNGELLGALLTESLVENVMEKVLHPFGTPDFEKPPPQEIQDHAPLDVMDRLAFGSSFLRSGFAWQWGRGADSHFT